MILIIDFGGQLTHVIAKVLRKNQYFSEVLHCKNIDSNTDLSKYDGFILSGSQLSVRDQDIADDAYAILQNILENAKPILGICFGYQVIASYFQGKIQSKNQLKEFGPCNFTLSNVPNNCQEILMDIPMQSVVLMSHSDTLTSVPVGFINLGYTDKCQNAFIANKSKNIYGVQFHPESEQSDHGDKIIINFAKISNCTPNWTQSAFIDQAIKNIPAITGTDKILCAVSGGVDSTVTTALLRKIINNKSQIKAVMLDTGLLRKYDIENTSKVFECLDIDLKIVNISKKIFKTLKGVTEPEEKRSKISYEYSIALKEEMHDCSYMAQGTIYSDIIESGVTGAAKIKTHHNASEHMKSIPLIEPIRHLFKDEVRELGRGLGVYDAILNCQPFPGPGLALRIIGEVNAKMVKIIQNVDMICHNFMIDNNLYNDMWQMFPILLDIQSVGIIGDQRAYGYVIALRGVVSNDGMTCDVYKPNIDVLCNLGTIIVNNTPEVTRVVYDITSKPPASIEWQ